MLSPSTFNGVANAISPAGQPLSPQVQTGRVQQVRVLSAPPPTPLLPGPGPGVRSPVTVSPDAPAAPPRNLPRGSLLDLSV
jgi:hypothetical protein